MILFGFETFIYREKKVIKMKKRTKINRAISLDRILSNIIDDTIANRSKYVEWLIYQDLLKNSKDNRIKEVII
jgi:hypothetical protein